MKRKFGVLEEKIISLQRENSDLSRRNSELERDVEYVGTKLHEKEKMMLRSEEQKGHTETKISGLLTKISELENLLQEQKTKSSTNHDKASELLQSISKIQTEKNILDDSVKQISRENSEIKERNSIIKAEISELTRKIAEQKTQISELEKEKSLLEKKLRNSESAILLLKKQVSELQSLEPQISDLKKKKKELEMMNSQTHKDLEYRNSEFSRVLREKEEVEKTKSEISREKLHLENKILELEMRFLEISREKSDLDNQMLEMKFQCEQWKEDRKQLADQLSTENNTIGTKIQELHNLRSERDELRTQLRISDARVKQIDGEKLELAQNLDSFRTIIGQLQMKNHDLEIKLSESSEKQGKIESEMKRKDQEVMELKGRENQLREKNTAMNQQIQNLKQSLTNADRKIAEFTKNFSELDVVVSERDRRLSELENSNSVLSSEKRTVSDQLTEITGRYFALEKENIQLTEKWDQIRSCFDKQNATLVETQAERDRLAEENANLRKDIEWKLSHSDLRNSELQTEMTIHSHKKAELEMKISELDRMLISFKRQCEQLQVERKQLMEKLSEENRTSGLRIQEYMYRIEEVTSQHASYKKKAEETISQMQKDNLKAEEDRNEKIHQLGETILWLEKEKKQLEELQHHAHEETIKLKEMISETEKKVEFFKTSILSEREEKDRLKDSISFLEEEKKKMHMKLEHAMEENVKLKATERNNKTLESWSREKKAGDERVAELERRLSENEIKLQGYQAQEKDQAEVILMLRSELQAALESQVALETELSTARPAQEAVDNRFKDLTNLFNVTLNVMSSTALPPMHNGVDKGCVLLIETILNNPSNFFDDPSCTNLSAVVDTLSREALRVQTKGQMVFWFQQVCYMIDTLLQAYPWSTVTPGCELKKDGIYVVGDLVMSSNSTQTWFMYHLYSILLEIYKSFLEIVLDNLKSTLIPSVYIDLSRKPFTGNSKLSKKHGHGHLHGHDHMILIGILSSYDKALKHLQKWKVYDHIVLQFFHQIYHYTDVALFNELLRKPDMYCTAERGFHIKLILSQLDDWKLSNLKSHAAMEISLRSIGTMQFMNQVANLLVVEKAIMKDMQLINTLFPALNLDHLYYILLHFQPSHMAPNPVDSSILRELFSMGARDVGDPSYLYVK
eukprot:TRINITY_DN8077_c0_g2_i1.p1 TRINITY_DN8077_c0_g2~~TRINITY_DN8077_c0_g2_i1.p1  ORF type:complete len:1148 (+),score=334.16 TRINITY_DN8077_c0_g2_i1:171-3614(+)